MPERKKVNIVLDVNWYISACISRSSRHTLYYKILKNQHIEVFYSRELLQEFEGVISRPKFRKIISYDQAIRFRSVSFLFLTSVVIKSIPKVVRDVKDDYLLGICESCHADFLVTGDTDLLILKSYGNTAVVTMNEFLQLLPSFASG